MKDTILSTDREPIQWPLEILARTKLCMYTGEPDIGEWGLIRPARPSLSRRHFIPSLDSSSKPATGKSMLVFMSPQTYLSARFASPSAKFAFTYALSEASDE